MGIEKPDQWKYSKEKMNNLLGDADKAQEAVEKTIGVDKNKAKEEALQSSSQELVAMNTSIVESQSVRNTEDVKNAKTFVANLPKEIQDTLGLLSYNTWSGEDVA
jgi:hypothetical protein